jgi:hypothetical protein
MMTSRVALLSAVAVLFAGCADHRGPVVLDTVGPSAVLAVPSGPAGALVVFSAFDGRLTAANDADHRRHSDYRVFAADGRLLRDVRNDSGTVWEGPVQIELPPGSYRVVARANGYGSVTVPLVVAAGRVTEVHLEGGNPRADQTSFTAVDPVRLPDGQVVGRRAAIVRP